MILIADSGSTKCSWAICDEKGTIIDRCSTIGFNPYFISSSAILNKLESSDLTDVRQSVSKVYFYGAGCSSEKMNKIVEDPFKKFFVNSEINVLHDLDAACYSMYDGTPSITGILGTGSNSCLFDGEKIHESAPSLGYTLGDEASGNYIGRKLINLYFNNKLNKDLKSKYEEKYETNISKVNSNVYSGSRANVYLAKFFPFVSDNKKDPQMQKLILDCLDEFFDLHISCFENYENHKINFIGSVAYFLQEELEVIATKYNCKLGMVIKNPIDKLIEYHFNK